MEFLLFLVAWANVPFTIAAGVAVLFAALSATGILGMLAGAGQDAEGDGHDADGGHDADADADADGDGHDADADDADAHDADDGASADDGARSVAAALMGGLGIGRLPLSLIWQSYAVIFAATGICLNAGYLRDPGGPPLLTLAWTIPGGLLVGYAAVAGIARVMAPVLSTKDQEATSRAQLVGQAGVVISSRVTADFGEIRIHDRTGHQLRVICKLAPNQRELVEGEQVVVVGYDAASGLRVAPLDLEPTPRTRRLPQTS